MDVNFDLILGSTMGGQVHHSRIRDLLFLSFEPHFLPTYSNGHFVTK